MHARHRPQISRFILCLVWASSANADSNKQLDEAALEIKLQGDKCFGPAYSPFSCYWGRADPHGRRAATENRICEYMGADLSDSEGKIASLQKLRKKLGNRSFTVLMTLDYGGKISKLSIIQSSGSVSVDNMALEMLKSCAPLTSPDPKVGDVSRYLITLPDASIQAIKE